jgi:hypothetical protein
MKDIFSSAIAWEENETCSPNYDLIKRMEKFL